MVTVQVPATSANLGPGFDLLGLALPLYNRLKFRPAEALSIRHTGPQAAGLPEDASHLAYRAAAMLCEAIGRPVPTWALEMDVAIPQSRGLGSSSAAIVAGLVGANAWHGDPLDRAALLALATRLEGHPDNVAPALYGGVTAAFEDGDEVRCLELTRTAPASLVVAVPDFELATAVSRRALPEAYSRADVVANLASVTVLTTVMLKGGVEWWPFGLRDRIHQPYRLALIPGADAVADAARRAGAYGTVISGAGPALLAFCPADAAERTAEAMVAGWRSAGISARALHFTALDAGARVLENGRTIAEGPGPEEQPWH